MEKPIVACIQHHLIVPKTTDEYPAYLNRFLRTAKAKGAVLALFPELSGIATAIPTLSGWRNNLLKTAGQGMNPKSGFWDRTKSAAAGGMASVLQADLRKSLASALQNMPESLHDAYMNAFSGLARQYEMIIVAGSVLEVQPDGQDIHNVAVVFGPDGSVLGRQAKVVLGERDRAISTPAAGWGVIPTPAGKVGILIGEDALYPEPARILAYQGADMLVMMAAVTRPATYQKIRQASLARCQENQLYGMISFLTGPDPFSGADAPPFVGASAIFAPSDFTPRFTGVMVEVGSPLAEGVITAEWDYPALVELWDESDTPLRRNMPLQQAGSILATVFGRGVPLAEASKLLLETPAPAALPAAPPTASPAVEPPLETYAVVTPILPEPPYVEVPTTPAPAVAPSPGEPSSQSQTPEPLADIIATPAELPPPLVAEELPAPPIPPEPSPPRIRLPWLKR